MNDTMLVKNKVKPVKLGSAPLTMPYTKLGCRAYCKYGYVVNGNGLS